MRTDTELLDGLEALTKQGGCPGIINDDNGHWAVSGTGMQNCVAGEAGQDVSTSFYVGAAEWKNSVREAIDAYLVEYLDSSGDEKHG